MSKPKKMVISSRHGFGPEAETRVPCPACAKGMVTPHVATLVRDALKDEPAPLPMLNTETMSALDDERDPCDVNGHTTCPYGCNRCLVCEYCKCTHPKRH